jgi:peptide/nickel transport system ATP-binding protein
MNVSVSYRSVGTFRSRFFAAVDDVSLTIPAGRVVALVGESGCGKSTIARALVGLVQPTHGTICLDGVALGRRRPREQRLRVQMVFQNPKASLNPRRSVRATLAEALTAAGAGIDIANGATTALPASLDDRIAALLGDVDLPSSVLDRRPGQLSGGQCQRVAIARALALDPDFIVADEITAALDATVAASVIALLRRQADERGTGVLFITHDLGAVAHIADSVAVMYLGRIVEHGPSAQMLTRPRHPYTRGLLEARPDIAVRRSHPVSIVGEINDSADVGCRFAPRCPTASHDCRAVQPDLASSELVDHRVACHHPITIEPVLTHP